MSDQKGFAVPAEHLVVGGRGPEARVSGRVAAVLERHAGLDRFRQENRGRDSELDAALLALHYVAKEWRGTATGTTPAEQPEPPASSEWVGTRTAANHLGITERGICKAIAEQRLPAEKRDGRWQIHREDLAHYRERTHNK